MIESLGAGALSKVGEAAAAKAAEVARNSEMAQILQQQETLRLGEIQAREVLVKDEIARRETSAADELQHKLNEEAGAKAEGRDLAPEERNSVQPIAEESPADLKRENDQQQIRTDLGSDARIYEAAGVQVSQPVYRELGGRTFETYRTELLNGNYIGPGGESNLDLMTSGRAPYVEVNGTAVRVDLHHHGQNGDGPLVELDSNTHKEHHGELHPKNGKGEGRGDDPTWTQTKAEYWKQRATEF